MGLKQHGGGFVTGIMDDLVYYQRGGKFYVRKRPAGLSKKVRTAPCYANTRRNASEFSTAVGHAKRIRAMLGTRIRGITAHDPMNRLHSIFIQSVRSGVGNWGERMLNVATLSEKLAGYEFGHEGSFFDLVPELMNLGQPSPLTTISCTVTAGQVTSTVPEYELNLPPEIEATYFTTWVAHFWYDGENWLAGIHETSPTQIGETSQEEVFEDEIAGSSQFFCRVVGCRLWLGADRWNFGRDDAAIVDVCQLL